jgi:hypothetical protein
MSETSPRAFITYSHADAGVLDRLKIHLKPIVKKYKFLIWDDRQLRAGDKWRQKIEENIAESDVIIVLLSADFLASDFVMDYEYPKALSQANDRGAKIVVLMVSPCLYEEFELSDFHFVNDPKQTLQDVQADDNAAIHERIFVNTVQIVRDYLNEAARIREAAASTGKLAASMKAG